MQDCGGFKDTIEFVEGSETMFITSLVLFRKSKQECRYKMLSWIRAGTSVCGSELQY